MPASVDAVAITVGDGGARVSGLLLRPPDARWLYLLAHGAGAGMRHPFLETIARALAEPLDERREQLQVGEVVPGALQE